MAAGCENFPWKGHLWKRSFWSFCKWSLFTYFVRTVLCDFGKWHPGQWPVDNVRPDALRRWMLKSHWLLPSSGLVPVNCLPSSFLKCVSYLQMNLICRKEKQDQGYYLIDFWQKNLMKKWNRWWILTAWFSVDSVISRLSMGEKFILLFIPSFAVFGLDMLCGDVKAWF